jgi:SAM-dependent methyltransferase
MLTNDILNALRAAEIDSIAPELPAGGRVLEIGAGTGQQALELQRRGFAISAIEIESSGYADARVFPVVDYDGVTLPFPNATFDAVFSSSALEHVRDLANMHAEIRRVLKPGGVAVHVLPTSAWRFWTMTTSFPRAAILLGSALRRTLPGSRDPRSLRRAWRDALQAGGSALLQSRHGERGTGFSELWLFHPRWWRSHFRENGFTILRDRPMGLFYTGTLLFGLKLPLQQRAHLARILGSACHLFVLAPDAQATSDR